MAEKELTPMVSQTRAVMERIALMEIGGSIRTVPVTLARRAGLVMLFLNETPLGTFTDDERLVDALRVQLEASVDRIARALVKDD